MRLMKVPKIIGFNRKCLFSNDLLLVTNYTYKHEGHYLRAIWTTGNP